MKKQILATLVLITGVLATATAEKTQTQTGESTSKNVVLISAFQKLDVEGNVEVVLYEDNSNTVHIFSSPNNIAGTSVTERNGVLYIKSKRVKGEKTLVYVPVKNIEEIEAAGNAKITSATILSTQDLTLLLNGDCKIDVQVTGNIHVLEGDVSEVIYEKKLSRI